ncbi:hypothetical protein Misp06_02451 [Microbulbifer sp. NBRC 101763]|uniref:acyl carrier protein n=1 Tax=unclassified Microbulbifer TaxID=2619833 RepID=UPI0030B17097
MNRKSTDQKALIREVEQLLNETDVRPTDNFIELGGNSFLALQLAINLKDRDNIEVDVARLLGNTLECVLITTDVERDKTQSIQTICGETTVEVVE